MTIRELAKELGLGKTVVANALRGLPRVKRETREWVQKRARELGYKANPLASGFLQQVRSRGAKTYRANLALLLPMDATYPINAELSAGARERAQELGYGLDIIRSEEIGMRNLTRTLLARGILGVMVGPMDHPMEAIPLDWSKFAIAVYGYSMALAGVHRIVHNHAQGIRTLLKMCEDKGFRRIGLLLEPKADSRSNNLWSAAYLGFQQQLPHCQRVPLFSEPDAKSCPHKIDRWIKKEKPDVVIAHTMKKYLTEQLEHLPKRIPYVVLDRGARDSVAGIDQQFRLSGRLLTNLLSSEILHNERGIHQAAFVSMVDGLWVDHPSLSKPARV